MVTARAESIEDLRDSYALCRGLGHWWPDPQALPDDVTAEDYGAYFEWRYYRCERCGTTRLDLMHTISGDIERRRYVYPDGYQLDEKVTRSQLRLDWARRRAAFAAGGHKRRRP